MTGRRWWITVFTLATVVPIGMEIWAAIAGRASMPTWTEMITTYFPQELVLPAVGLLTAWLGPHFVAAFRQRSTLTWRAPAWWLRADGANRAWRSVLQGAVASVLIAAGDVVIQAARAEAEGGTVVWPEVLRHAELAGGTAALMAVLAYLHRTVGDPSALPSAQPPDPPGKPPGTS